MNAQLAVWGMDPVSVHQADLDQKIVVDGNRIHSQCSQLCVHHEPLSFLFDALNLKQIVCQITFRRCLYEVQLYEGLN